MDNVISLNRFVAKKEQEKIEAEKSEYKEISDMVSQIMEANPVSLNPFFAYSTADNEPNDLETAVMKLMDALTLLDNLGKKKEAMIVDRVVADLLGIEVK
jgi:hypothetical protein